MACGQALAAPPPFDARYGLWLDDERVGEVRLSLVPATGGLEYRAVTRPAGWLAALRRERIEERSRLETAGGDLRPRSYSYRRRSLTGSREARVRFDWQEHRAYNTVGGKTWAMVIPEGTMDKLSVQLAVMDDLARGALTAGYPVADGGWLKQYRYQALGEEQTTTPAGTFRTVRLSRRRTPGAAPEWLWCAPELAWLPVRVRRTVDHDGAEGRIWEMRLEAVDGLPASPP